MRYGKRPLILLSILFLTFTIYAFDQYRANQERIRKANELKEQRRNIYLITASGLRAGHLSSYLYQPIQTPSIDFLAYDGVRFTNAFTTSPQSLAAHLSLLTGIYPFRASIQQTLAYFLEMSNSALPKFPTTLPVWFGEKGYKTAAFLSDSDLRHPSFFLKLFQEVNTCDQPLFPWQSSYSAPMVCKIAREWVVRNWKQSQFLWINFDEPTHPFQPPVPFDRQYSGHPYDGEVAALDEQIGLFISLLKDTGLFQKSIVIFTSPYGESLGKSSRFASPANEILHVPLLIAAPGILPRHVEYKSQVGLADIFPTVLSLLNYDARSKLDGLPLFQKGSIAEIKRDLLMGSTRIPRLFGFPEDYYVRSKNFLFNTVEEENRITSNTSRRPTDAEKTAWLQKAEEVLKTEGLRPPSRPEIKLQVDPAVLLEKSILLARQGRAAWALDLLSTFSEQLPQTPYLDALSGWLSAASRDPESALIHYQKAYKASRNPLLLEWIAKNHLEAGRSDEALESLQKYAKLVRPLSYDINSMLGIVLYHLKRPEEALAELDKAVEGNPRYAEALAYRGMAWKELGNRQNAERNFREAIETNPEGELAYRELASLLLARGAAIEAVPYLRRILELRPADYAVMLDLATIHRNSGNEGEARKLFEQVILYAEDPKLKSRAKELLVLQ